MPEQPCLLLTSNFGRNIFGKRYPTDSSGSILEYALQQPMRGIKNGGDIATVKCPMGWLIDGGKDWNICLDNVSTSN